MRQKRAKLKRRIEKAVEIVYEQKTGKPVPKVKLYPNNFNGTTKKNRHLRRQEFANHNPKIEHNHSSGLCKNDYRIPKGLGSK